LAANTQRNFQELELVPRRFSSTAASSYAITTVATSVVGVEASVYPGTQVVVKANARIRLLGDTTARMFLHTRFPDGTTQLEDFNTAAGGTAAAGVAREGPMSGTWMPDGQPGRNTYDVLLSRDPGGAGSAHLTTGGLATITVWTI
jgi:hypothetical protein